MNVASSSAAQKSLASPRVMSAVRVLAHISQRELMSTISERIHGRATMGLPPLMKEEEPTSIFVDAVDYGGDETLNRELRSVCGIMLKDVCRSGVADKALAGELCYLAAAINSTEALSPLSCLAAQANASDIELPSGQDLRVSALRALVGLLASSRESLGSLQSYRPLLEYCLGQPRCQFLALTGLVGLWPESKATFVGMLSEALDERKLDTALVVAGFRPLEHSTTEPKQDTSR